MSGTGSGDDGDDIDREAILARRGRMISAALAGLMVASCSADSPPQPCLSPPVETDPTTTVTLPEQQPADAGTPPPDAGSARPFLPPPGVCLSISVPEDAGPPPQPCLSPLPPPRPDAGAPRPCLSPPVRKPSP